MPNEPLFEKLARDADRITEAIDRRQRALGKRLTQLERRLYDRLRDDLFPLFEFRDGRLADTVANLLLIERLDELFRRWVLDEVPDTVRDFVGQLIATAAMTAAYYSDFDGQTVDRVRNDNAILFAALGVNALGQLNNGGLMSEIALASKVRQELKTVVLSAIKSGQTLGDFTRAVKDYLTAASEAGGSLTRYWRTYAFDLFNQTAEIKNEEFRRALNLKWFIYVGDIIKDSRAFCIKKAGKVFATIEADTEWPGDPDLIGKNSGIPYTPRIDRGRWNCRHRIRYISRELAAQLDPRKVSEIERKYGRNSL